MNIHIYEKNERALSCAERLRADGTLLGYEDIYLLPIPTSRDGVTLGSSGLCADEAIAASREGTLFVGYGIPDGWVGEIARGGGVVCDCALDEEFLLENAELTALGAVGIILTELHEAPCDATVGIVGYGRIGQRLCRHLLSLGYSVRIYTRRRSVQLDLGEMGIPAQDSTEPCRLDGLSLLVNTAPAKIFDTDAESFPRDLRIIDLASGNNFDSAQAVKYPSLPALMYPRGAGIAWARSVERMVGGGQ